MSNGAGTQDPTSMPQNETMTSGTGMEDSTSMPQNETLTDGTDPSSLPENGSITDTKGRTCYLLNGVIFTSIDVICAFRFWLQTCSRHQWMIQ
ncbi:hypothetical protein CROQUDRAFT_612076 [Cronartium quercuum f. sp. fusiforme G11]|uniref:Uncharacterized protein n=1 Tax=Cronartium quercuum f. sp. fusiforme G11 TaxID=708437 RepID=A0A9P6NIM4_9BASI|nr:hypothetical protein CROQUDRAFT_612076 [Cronartium quercuum f. sp. fusiforme G11]